MDRSPPRGAVSLNDDRTVERLAELGTLGATLDGLDRPLFSAADRLARRRFAEWSDEDGRDLEQDAVGNLFARRAGATDATILVGSHLDTVRNGGKYDGAYGVIGALGALRLLDERAISLVHTIEVAAWAGEEGSRFPLGCLGSSVYAGLTTRADVEALVDGEGTVFSDARDGADGLLRGVPVRSLVTPPRAYLELHIEQGPILEMGDHRLGIVTAIAGQRRYELSVTGAAGHAGTVPMTMRRDALCAAAEIVVALERAATDLGECVLTVGHLVVEPNQTNVIPGRVIFRVDARSIDETRLDSLEQTLHRLAAAVATQRDVRLTHREIERRASVPMNAQLRETIAGGIAQTGERWIDVPSGAGHDAMCIAAVAPAAMIFVPSVGGLSHVGEEHTEPDDLRLGVEALAHSIVAVDRSLT